MRDTNSSIVIWMNAVMKMQTKQSFSPTIENIYPGGANGAGVPLTGQTGQQAVKNFDQILSQMRPAERRAFNLARARACQEAELWQGCSKQKVLSFRLRRWLRAMMFKALAQFRLK